MLGWYRNDLESTELIKEQNDDKQKPQKFQKSWHWKANYGCSDRKCCRRDGRLTAPAAGAETRRRLRGEVMDARERAKTAAGNVESRARELVDEVNNPGQTSTAGAGG
jgi:hypothetical protein